MSKLFDDIARTLASPMPRRKVLRAVGQLLGGAALVALFPRAAAAAGCGTTVGAKVVVNTTSGRCVNGAPDATLTKTALSSGAFACPGNCPGRTVGTLSCTGGAPGNGQCSPGRPCTVTAASLTCACNPTSCGVNNCCCTTNGTCQSSLGSGGNCVPGFAGC